MGRSPLSPHPMMGLPPGWRISDLTPAYTSQVLVIPATTTSPITSAAINPHANSVEIILAFVDQFTSCDVALSLDDGTGTFNIVKTFTGCTIFNTGGLTVGEWPTGISLNGRSIKVTIQNRVGPGTVAASVLRLN